MKLRRVGAVVLLLAGLAHTGISPAGDAGTSAPDIHRPDTLQWASPPWDARVSATWILGTEKGPGRYLQRVRIEPGGRIPRHAHPDARETTVLSGTLHVSFGSSEDPTRDMRLPVGSVYVVPAGVAHEVWAGTDEVTYQESGVGPTATNLLTPR